MLILICIAEFFFFKIFPSEMKIIEEKIKRSELINNFMTHFKTIIKAVVDIERKIMAVDAELHSDLESLLIENGSQQKNLWGINLYPFKERENFIEYIALINIRPSQGNYSVEIEDERIRESIREIVFNLVEYES